MKLRFVFRILVLLTGFHSLFAQRSDGPIGKCYPSLNEWIESIAGPNGFEDENIKIQKTSFTDGSFWLIDSTPSKNRDWYLLRPQKKEKLCLILQTSAFQIRTIEKGKQRMILSKIQGSGNFPMREITFVSDFGETIFQPKNCVEIVFHGKKIVRKKFSCASFLE
ncbi:hypothetical protein JWG44_14255 [Leptospira sp. 201903071]|uniref:hypothetical protein n=1 Tax=Leptospira ainazelensis TaxID=2810034 RepID=UPI001965BB4A|nr:hypothetical protein [Leptospira ainazelensis]MBM9501414.1 hypothetical protein [Leptospira ainazelensis]